MARPENVGETQSTVAYHGLRDWLEQVDKLGELLKVSGAHWDREMGAITQMLTEGGKGKAPAIVFDGWRLFNGDEIEKIPGVRYMGLGYLTPWNEAMSQGSSPSERKSSVRAADSIETRR